MRQALCLGAWLMVFGLGAPSLIIAESQTPPPNVILIFTDDQGYNDLGCYAPEDPESSLHQIKTPHIDQMAAEGMRFTSFYSAASVCTPSRAALLTGCYAQRIGMTKVLFPYSTTGLNANEITIAETLKEQGYRTGIVGKWHLGHHDEFLPTRHGFDSYFGVPYSNDMVPCILMENEDLWSDRVDQSTLTDLYTQRAIEFIHAHKDEPFFLYLPHTMPHLPWHVPPRFEGVSEHGLYGDMIAHLDWSTGEILKTLKALKLDQNTLVIYTSDNGHSKTKKRPVKDDDFTLHGNKAQIHEGGMRVPCVAWWPGTIAAGSQCDTMATMMDWFPTIADYAGTSAPSSIDGRNIRSLLEGQNSDIHDAFFYFRKNSLRAVRSGPWKLFADTPASDAGLYHAKDDPDAQHNLLESEAQQAAQMVEQSQSARDELVDELMALSQALDGVTLPKKTSKFFPDTADNIRNIASQLKASLGNPLQNQADCVLTASVPKMAKALNIVLNDDTFRAEHKTLSAQIKKLLRRNLRKSPSLSTETLDSVRALETVYHFASFNQIANTLDQDPEQAKRIKHSIVQFHRDLTQWIVKTVEEIT